MADPEEALRVAAIEYGRAFAETNPKQAGRLHHGPSENVDRRLEAHKRLTDAARRFEAWVRTSSSGTT